MWVLKSLKVTISGRHTTRIKIKILHTACHFNFVRWVMLSRKKCRLTSMVEPFLWLCWLNVEPHFIAFLTGKMCRPQISLKIGRFGPGFQWTKCRSIFWKENRRICDHFVLSLSWARTFLSGELAILKSGIFLIQLFPFGFLSLELQTSFKFVDAKGLTN